MKHNNIGFLLREGARAMFKHGFMSFAAICVTIICLVFIASFGLLSYNLDLVVESVQEQNVVLAFIDENYTEAEAKNVWSQINQLSNVEQVQYMSKQESFDNFLDGIDNPELFEDVKVDFLRYQLTIKLTDNDKMDETIAEINKIPGIKKVSADPEIAMKLSNLRDALYVATVSIAAIAVFASLLIISNTVKLAMADRREEIAIMKMVGATDGFIQIPFVVEGFFIGIVGGAFAFLAEWCVYEAIRSLIEGLLNFVNFVPFEQVSLLIAVGCGVSGLLIGIFGGLMSIRRFLKV